MKQLAIPSPAGPSLRSKEARAAILAAAGRIFAKSGLAGARTDTIAAAAAVNKAMLYYYFGSKQGLYEAVVEDHFCEFNRQALDVLESNDRELESAPETPRRRLNLGLYLFVENDTAGEQP